MAKGSEYERHICKELSKWWSLGNTDNIFWRSASSGARATQRTARGKQTKGHYGDICAVDPNGQSFIDVFTVEIKRGYGLATIADLLDKTPKSAVQQWEKWHAQVMEAWKHSGSLSWMLITKRDNRAPLIFMPRDVADWVVTFGSSIGGSDLAIRTKDKGFINVFAIQFQDFLNQVSPETIREISRRG